MTKKASNNAGRWTTVIVAETTQRLVGRRQATPAALSLSVSLSQTHAN